ncbi:unnamed protein product [Linum trigynum]|uniref:Uncharacterized protein n=1 Tax=Linum trigynum TaxID=586398 RepID=A0AAV2GTU6_9ROSI
MFRRGPFLRSLHLYRRSPSSPFIGKPGSNGCFACQWLDDVQVDVSGQIQCRIGIVSEVARSTHILLLSMSEIRRRRL